MLAFFRWFYQRPWAMIALVMGAACAAIGSLSPVHAAPAQASRQEAVGLLNRVAFGPSEGDVEHVMAVGVDAYIDEQLHPERIALPRDLAAQLAALDSTQEDAGELVAQFRDAQRAVRADRKNGNAGVDAKDTDTSAKDERRDLFRRIGFEAGDARLMRAVQSPRQLEEVMVDFWFNHFNVFEGKGIDRVLVASYERDAIRPYVFGRFRDLLGATAHHAAMLFYLDNWQSAAPDSPVARRGGGAAKATGLNENYARELMELHTLGVDGGYTQADVTQLARILTGWTIDPRRGDPKNLYRFDADRHDWGDKEWLGRHVAPRGQAEGEWALDVLAQSPATAHHIAYELAQYFVADEPPQALVDRLAQRFLATQGDLRAVMQTLLTSPEFRVAMTKGGKFKTPYQYVVSAVRASGVPIANARPMLGALRQLGMPLYGCQTPDGYKNTEDAWLNPDAMTRRIGFATALGAGRLGLQNPPVEANEPRASREPGQPVDAQSLLALLDPVLSAKTRETVQAQPAAMRAALVLGSPDFMKH